MLSVLLSAPLISAFQPIGAVVAPMQNVRADGLRDFVADDASLELRRVPPQVNVGIIGAGRIGLVHLEALANCANARPTIISNPTVSKAEAAAAGVPGMEFTGEAMDVINHPDVEAVWICSPSQFHAEQILACADAGKHIFCEKPLATDLKETLDAVNYCRTKGVKLMTALQRRFDPNFVRCKEAVVNGEIGKPIVIKLCSRDPAPPPRSYVEGGGGIFKDMAVHDLDMARFLMGCEPVRVLATGACNVDPTIADLEAPECYDSANIIVKFENGKECIIDVCRKAVYGYDQRAEILCEDGMVMTDNMHPSTVRMFNRDFVGHADKPYDFFMSRYSEAYKAETLAFIECLVEDKPSPCTGRDGIVALVMAMAAGKSAVEERWVDFGEILREEKIIDVSSMLNSEGKLGKNWVRAMMLGLSRDASSIEDMEDLFAISDLDGDGFVNQVEALAILSRMGIEMNESEMKAMITKADKDGNGKMDLAEFKAMLFDSGVKLAKNQLFNYVN